IREQSNGWTGVGYRVGLSSGTARDHLNSIAERFGNASLSRFEPQLMAIPAVIDPSRKFRMDPDGFGLATLLDDILGYDPERFLQLSKEFCEFFPEFRRVRVQTEMALQRSYAQTGIHGSSQGNGKGIYFETSDGGTVR